jgi:GNAT superfamily N-acetyltransferase
VGEKLEQIRIVRLAEGDPTDAETAGWHALWNACAPEGEAGPAARQFTETVAVLRAAESGSRTLRWLAWDGETAVGLARLRLFADEGRRHLGRFRVSVPPEQRGRGLGTALLAEVRAAAEAEGCGTLLTGVAAGSPGDAFLTAAGSVPAGDVRRLLLRVADCDREALRTTVRGAADGYQLARWQGVAPADLIHSFGAARDTVNDTLADGADGGTVGWDEARVRAFAQDKAALGHTLLTVAALGTDGGAGDGEGGAVEVVAGFSEIVLPGGGATRARQSGTAVLKAHRGHGLGLWLKAAMLEWLLGAHPEVEEVVTACDAGNRHMIAINEELGFLPDGSIRYHRLAPTGD